MDTTSNQQWLDDLAYELRLAGFDGRQVGEALSVVESDLAESGQDPTDAFGSPQEYARELAAATEPGRESLWSSYSRVLPIALGLLTFFLWLAAFRAVTDGGTLNVPLVVLGCVVLALAALLYASRDVRRVHRHWLVPVAISGAGVLAGVAVDRQWPPVIALPAAVTLTFASLVLIAMALWGQWRYRPDEVTSPVDGTSRPEPRMAPVRLAVTALNWLFVAGALGITVAHLLGG